MIVLIAVTRKMSGTVTNSPLFAELCESVAKETHNFTFACGGSIPIVPQLPENDLKPAHIVQETSTADDQPQDSQEDSQDSQEDSQDWLGEHSKHPGPVFDPAADDFDEPPTRSTLSLPVDLRWDSQNKSSLSQQTKISFPLTPETEVNLAKLVEDCELATFGRGGEDVYDESYRKATKMDPSRFSTTFNPYEVGIVDTIAQTLLPTLRHSQQTRTVKAELYKLNVSEYPLIMHQLPCVLVMSN